MSGFFNGHKKYTYTTNDLQPVAKYVNSLHAKPDLITGTTQLDCFKGVALDLVVKNRA
jgi:hypothetical protein